MVSDFIAMRKDFFFGKDIYLNWDLTVGPLSPTGCRTHIQINVITVF